MNESWPVLCLGLATVACAPVEPQARLLFGQEDIHYQEAALEATVLEFLGDGFTDGAAFQISRDDPERGDSNGDGDDEPRDISDIPYHRAGQGQLSLEVRTEHPIARGTYAVVGITGRYGGAQYRLPEGIVIPDVGTELPDPITVTFRAVQLEPKAGLAWKFEAPGGSDMRMEVGGGYAVTRVRTRVQSALIDADQVSTVEMPLVYLASELLLPSDSRGHRVVLRGEVRHFPEATTSARLSAGIEF